MQVLFTTTREWYLGHTAKAFSERNALAGLWMADKNRTGVPPTKYRRCWPYHLAMKPFYHCAPQIWDERATYAFTCLYKMWLRPKLRSPQCPKFDVAHGLMGFASELFERASEVGALKVLDCPNSHPTSYFGFWQRECDLWCPGEKVPIPRWMYARMNRELEQADVILCPSVFVRDMMALNGISANKCFVNPFGVNTSVFRKRDHLPAKPRFICVATISLRKGHQYLFRAFEIVKRTLPEAELVCVGDYKCDFRKERSRWAGTFTHYRQANHEQLSEMLRSCSAFVLTSVEEGFARVLSEAMAAALPIIATYETGATTLVRDGVEGLVVRGRDPQNIAEAMIKVASDSELNQRMGIAAHERGALQNTWQDYGNRLLAEYGQRIRQTPALQDAGH